MKNFSIVLLVLLGFSCAEKEVQLTNYKQWHTITLPFEGPDTSELSENNPFLNYRLIVEFSNGEEQFNVQGFYAADGNASETSADSGNIWQARFTPNTLGKWTYKAQMVQGDGIALKDAATGTAIVLKNDSGAFEVIPSDKKGADFICGS